MPLISRVTYFSPVDTDSRARAPTSQRLSETAKSLPFTR